MTMDERVRRHYEIKAEAGRLWDTAGGQLTRLRTWDILERFLAVGSRVADIGGGPGTHAAHLAGLGHEVVLVDPLELHVDQARRLGREAGFSCHLGDASQGLLTESEPSMLGTSPHVIAVASKPRTS